MFTGFATENSPAIQVWDYFLGGGAASSTQITHIALTDDCAPIQLFRVGMISGAIRVTLPSCPIEGKIIKIVVQTYGNATFQGSLSIYSSDAAITTPLYTIGPGGYIDLAYSKNVISPAGSGTRTGWLALNFASASSSSVNNSGGIALGNNSSAYAASAVAIGNAANATASGIAIASGNTTSATATNATCIGGVSNTANGAVSVCIGGNFGTARSITGMVTFAASRSPITSSAGVSQTGLLVLGRQTTDATATRLTSDSFAATTDNQLILPNNSAYVFQGTVIANRTGGGDTSGWRFEGTIKRGANAASTTLVAAVTPTVISQDAGAAAWVLAVTADTTNGGLAVTVTGAAATTIRWVCRLESTEVTF